MQSILIGCPQSQISFFPSFSITFQRFLFVVCNFVSSRSSSFSASHFTTNNLKVLMNDFIHSDPFSFLQTDRRWCNVSLCYPYNLHLSHSANPLILFHVLVSIICSCNANIGDVFLGYISACRSLLHYCIKKETLIVSAKSN